MLWAGVRGRAEVNGARVIRRDQVDERQVRGQPVIRSNSLILPFFKFKSGGRWGEKVGPGRNKILRLRRPQVEARTSKPRRGSKTRKDARGRAWSARKYARGRGQLGEGGLPFSPAGREPRRRGEGRKGAGGGGRGGA